MIGSEDAITRIEMRILAETRHATRDPVGGPVEHALDRHARRSKQPHRLRGIDQPRVGRFRALKDGLLPQSLSELLGEPTNADRWATDVKRARRHGTVI